MPRPRPARAATLGTSSRHARQRRVRGARLPGVIAHARARSAGSAARVLHARDPPLAARPGASVSLVAAVGGAARRRRHRRGSSRPRRGGDAVVLDSRRPAVLARRPRSSEADPRPGASRLSVATTSCWLAQRLPAVPARRRGTGRRRRSSRWRNGVLCALTLARRAAYASACSRPARSPRGASGRNGASRSGPLRRGYAGRARRSGPRRRADALGADRARARPRCRTLAGDALRRHGARLAVDAAEPRSAPARATRRCARTASRSSWLDPLPEPRRRLFAGGLRPSRRRGAVACRSGCGGSPARRARSRCARSSSARPVDRDAIDALDAEAVGDRGRRDDRRARSRADAVRRADARPDARDGAAAPERLDGAAALRRAAATTTGSSSPNGRLILGGRRDTSLDDGQAPRTTRRRRSSRASSSRSPRELLGRAPAITHRWSGCWGQTADLLPLVGRLPGSDRLWVAGGYSGHGNVLGFACGELVAQAIARRAGARARRLRSGACTFRRPTRAGRVRRRERRPRPAGRGELTAPASLASRRGFEPHREQDCRPDRRCASAAARAGMAYLRSAAHRRGDSRLDRQGRRSATATVLVADDGGRVSRLARRSATRVLEHLDLSTPAAQGQGLGTRLLVEAKERRPTGRQALRVPAQRGRASLLRAARLPLPPPDRR